MTTTMLSCPKCGGSDLWDNRESKRSPRAPDWRCKRRDCDGAIWAQRRAATPVQPSDAPSVLEPRQSRQVPPQGTGSAGEGSGQGRADLGAGRGSAARESMAACYLSCVRFVLEKVRPEYERAGIPMDAATVSAVTAQLFIARCNRGR